MAKYKRMRYYKVERIIQGFYVPDHLRDEVKKRTWAQTLAAMDEWDTFLYKNYGSELTPTTYDSRVDTIRLIVRLIEWFALEYSTKRTNRESLVPIPESGCRGTNTLRIGVCV